jgi:hypothetical protein
MKKICAPQLGDAAQKLHVDPNKVGPTQCWGPVRE